MKKIFNSLWFITIICCLVVMGNFVTREWEKGTASLASQREKVNPPAISAKGAILIDMDTGQTLFEQNVSARLYPASTTKIMTALVVLEICETQRIDLKSEVLVPKEAEGVEGSSIYLKAGEKMSVEKLLYGLMLESGNDSAVCLAVVFGGGNMDEFISMMNAKATELGCEDTNFTNPHGLPDEKHYTTAKDLAVIAKEAMEKEDFRKIVGSKEWGDFYNKNKTVHQYDGGTGIKIGYTKASGRTLVASAERDGKRLLAVLLNDGNWFEDAYALFDWGFGEEASQWNTGA